jgi:ABC-type amino acid transport substrate-binding protein
VLSYKSASFQVAFPVVAQISFPDRPLTQWGRWFILIGAAWLTVITAAGESPATPLPLIGQPLSNRKILIVGATTDSFPYGYLGDDGALTGFGGDLLDAVARVMNLQIKRVSMPGRQLQARFRTGEFDFLQALSQTGDRETYAEFSVPYLTLQSAILCRNKTAQSSGWKI